MLGLQHAQCEALPQLAASERCLVSGRFILSQGQTATVFHQQANKGPHPPDLYFHQIFICLADGLLKTRVGAEHQSLPGVVLPSLWTNSHLSILGSLSTAWEDGHLQAPAHQRRRTKPHMLDCLWLSFASSVQSVRLEAFTGEKMTVISTVTA